MNKPDIVSKIGGYEFQWINEHLTVNVTRLHVHSDGRVTGEIFIANQTKALYPESNFNFSAPITRKQLIKHLEELYPAQWNWQEIIDVLCHEVQTKARHGEPVADVWAEDDLPAPECLLAPIIYMGVPNIIFGEKGVNKSTLSYAFGVCLALPWRDNPLGLTVPDRSIKSLVLDWESEEPIFRWYLSRMKKGMALPEVQLFYRRCRLPLAEDLEAIEQFIANTNAEVLIIDSLAAAAGGESGELKGSQSALAFNAGLRKLHTTSLIIAQTSKDIESKKKSIYGSVMFTYYSRNIFELCQSEPSESEDIVHTALFHRDCNLGKRAPPMGFKLTYQGTNNLSIEREPVSVAEFSQKFGVRQRILQLLKDGSHEIKEIAEVVGVSENSARVNISTLKKQGKVIKVEGGYALSINR